MSLETVDTRLELKTFEAHIDGERTCPSCESSWKIEINARISRGE